MVIKAKYWKKSCKNIQIQYNRRRSLNSMYK